MADPISLLDTKVCGEAPQWNVSFLAGVCRYHRETINAERLSKPSGKSHHIPPGCGCHVSKHHLNQQITGT